jgi:hypothetical protein
MRNIFLLPTDKLSRLYTNNRRNGQLYLTRFLLEPNRYAINQNIYITSDEEIKYNDYYLGEDGLIYCLVTTVNSNGKKIILTTDKDLIKDGVQAIDDGFLVWFVDNPNSKVVKIEKEQVNNKPGSSYSTITNYKYKIIIPKEETKQETVEEPDKWSLDNAKEFALNYFKKSDEVPSKGMFTYELLLRILEAGIECGYKFGTKRQAEKMFTYDELRRIAYNAYCLGQLEEPTENKYNLWIQQFKNK